MKEEEEDHQASLKPIHARPTYKKFISLNFLYLIIIKNPTIMQIITKIRLEIPFIIVNGSNKFNTSLLVDTN